MDLGARLRYARESVGLTLDDVQSETGIGVSSISDFENGKREPKLAHLRKFAELYKRSTAFFFGDEPVSQEIVLWRERPRENASEAERDFLRHCEHYHNLEVWCGERLSGTLPESRVAREAFGYPEAERLALKVRSELNLGDRPAQVLLRVLEEVCAVKVFHKSFEPSGTAASANSGVFGPAVLLNSSNVRWRRNFDLAHELFHLLTWSAFRESGGDSSVIAGDAEEKWATCFARNLLMPPEPFRVAVDGRVKDGRIAAKDACDIARQFDVSVEALVRQIHFQYRRGPEEEETTRAEIEKVRGWEQASNQKRRDNTVPEELPERYRSLAIVALRRGEISLGRFAEYMNISRREAMDYIEHGTEPDEEIHIAPA